MLNDHNKETETFPCSIVYVGNTGAACKLQHKEKITHTRTHTDRPLREYAGVCVCVCEGPFIYIPLTESAPKFAHVTYEIQTHTHMHIYYDLLLL